MAPFVSSLFFVCQVFIVLSVPVLKLKEQSQIDDLLLHVDSGDILSLWKNEKLEIGDFLCFVSTRPSFQEKQLTFIGRMWCPLLFGIPGRSRSYDRLEAKTLSIKDFLQNIEKLLPKKLKVLTSPREI